MYDKRLIWKCNNLFEKVPGTSTHYVLQILLDKKAFWSGYLKNDLLHEHSPLSNDIKVQSIAKHL